MTVIRYILFAVLGTALFSMPATAFEIHGQFASISYESQSLLMTFNNRLFMGRLRYLMRAKRSLTIEDEVRNKMDVLTQKVTQVLDMSPSRLHYSVLLCESLEQVSERAGKDDQGVGNGPGFYSTASDTVYLVASDATVQVVAHEIGHVVVEKYFKVRPPVKVHELLAQYAEKHIGN